MGRPKGAKSRETLAFTLRRGADYKCIDCQGPRSVGSASRCSRCYRTRVLVRRNLRADDAAVVQSRMKRDSVVNPRVAALLAEIARVGDVS